MIDSADGRGPGCVLGGRAGEKGKRKVQEEQALAQVQL